MESLTTLTEEAAGYDITTTKKSIEEPDQFVTPAQTPETSTRKPLRNFSNNPGHTPGIPAGKKKYPKKIAFGRSETIIQKKNKTKSLDKP